MAEITAVQNQRMRKSLVTLANANELVAELALGVVGNDISDSLKGSRITNGMIKTMVQNRFLTNLTKARKV